MKTVKIAIDEELLRAVDQTARRMKQSRSAVVRDALRGHLRRLELRTLEVRDRKGYIGKPQSICEARFWEAAAAWPEE